MRRLVVGLVACTMAVTVRAVDQPTVLWASDPVGPGETVVVIGDGWADTVLAEIARVADGRAGLPAATVTPGVPKTVETIVPLQVTPQSVKFVLPAKLPPGIFMFRLKSGTRTSDWTYLDAPAVWWFQGDQGASASPGGWIRVFGKNLALRESSLICLRAADGAVKLIKPEQVTPWHLRANLAGVKPGAYRVSVHNGAGGNAGWRDAGTLTVAVPVLWKADRFTVTDFGAVPNDTEDDTPAVQAALQKAEQNGGGVVFFPGGRYRITETLRVPRYTVLQGAGADQCDLYWPDRPRPLPVLIAGSNSFALRDLGIYAVNHTVGIASAPANQPGAGHVYLERLRLRLNRFAQTVNRDADETQRRLRTPTSVAVGVEGEDVRITDCDIFSSGMCLQLPRLRSSVVARNVLHNGPAGWYSIPETSNLIFEHNQLTSDEFGSGGGMSGNCHNVYYAHNRIGPVYGCDREGLVIDNGGGVYFGRIAACAGVNLTLAADPVRALAECGGSGVYLMNGRGAGQYREIVRGAGRELEVDRPWIIPPDTETAVVITGCFRNGLAIDNDFVDCGIAVCYYGFAVDQIAAGNRSVRSGGFYNIGHNYFGDASSGGPVGFEPSWYIQYLDNEIVEGNSLHSWSGAADSVFMATGAEYPKYATGPLVRTTIFRRNRIANNGRFRVKGRVQDVLLENNAVHNSEQGLEVSGPSAGVLLRGNDFGSARLPLAGSDYATVTLHPAERLLLSLPMAQREWPGLAQVPDWENVTARLRALAQQPLTDPAVIDKALAARQRILHLLAGTGASFSPELLRQLLGLSLTIRATPALDSLLATGQGGTAAAAIEAHLEKNAPALTLRATGRLTAVATAGPAAAPGALSLQPGTNGEVSCPILVPAGAWGIQPGQVEVAVTGEEITDASRSTANPGSGSGSLPIAGPSRSGHCWTIPVALPAHFGTGVPRDWLVVGPFPNRSQSALDPTAYPPELRLDVGAEYGTPTGTIRWQPVVTATDGLDLRALLSKEPNLVAYAVTVIRAKRALRATLVVAADDRCRLYLNDHPVLDNAAGGEQRAAVRLGPGENVLLCQVSQLTGAWSLRLQVRPDEPVAIGELAVVPVAELPALPRLRPPALPVTAVEHAGGMKWELRFSDDFERTELGGFWRVGVGAWLVRQGALTVTDVPGGGAVATFNRPVRAPWRLEYDASSPAPADLSCVWMHGDEGFQTGYFFGLGSEGNKTNKLCRDSAKVATCAKPIPEPGKVYHVIAQVFADRVQMYVNGEPQFDYQEKTWLPDLDSLGFQVWGEAHFDNVRIYQANP